MENHLPNNTKRCIHSNITNQLVSYLLKFHDKGMVPLQQCPMADFEEATA